MISEDHEYLPSLSGYADSSPTVPTKTAVVHDAHKVYEHVAGLAGEQAQIVIYGHSLGTAVSCQFVAELCRQNRENGTKGAGIMPRSDRKHNFILVSFFC